MDNVVRRMKLKQELRDLGLEEQCPTPNRGNSGSVSGGATASPEAVSTVPPYPFCYHPEKCCATGRCERRVGGELWCCAD